MEEARDGDRDRRDAACYLSRSRTAVRIYAAKFKPVSQVQIPAVLPPETALPLSL
jgi:hypothetical protein